MSQANPSIGSNKSGLVYRQEDNDGKAAIASHHKGATAPSYAATGMTWIDDVATPWLFKVYDGTDWITMGAINATTNTFTPYYGTTAPRLLNQNTDTGSADAYAVAPSPAITSYVTGQIITMIPANTNTGASTLAVNGLTAKNIKKFELGALVNLVAGDLTAGMPYTMIYDGTQFILLNAYPKDSSRMKGKLGSAIPASSDTTYTIDFDDGSRRVVTVTSDCTIAFSGGSGEERMLILDMVGAGSYTITWDDAPEFDGSTAITLTDGTDRLLVYKDADGTITISAGQLDKGVPA